jgi:protein-S-isoprenylcysteine O-methyltransferase Ste14
VTWVIIEFICWATGDVFAQEAFDRVKSSTAARERARRIVKHAVVGAGIGVIVAYVHPEPLVNTHWIRIAGAVTFTVVVALGLAAWRGRRRNGPDEERLARARIAFWSGGALGMAYALARVAFRFWA